MDLLPPFEHHPAADVFPMLVDDELQDLADDIKANGLIDPIVLLPDGRLLDGRNRVAACELADVPIRSRVYDGPDPITYVLSLNMARRHLTPGQRAVVALEVLPLYEAEAEDRRVRLRSGDAGTADLQDEGTESASNAAKATGASGRVVAQAKRIKKHDAEHGTNHLDKVKSGDKAIDAVHKQVKREQAQAEEQEAREITIDTVLRPDAEGDGWRMLHGDFRERLADLPDGSVDLIVTDPPYPREFLPLWGDMAEHAKRVLTDQGIVVAMTGQIMLPEVMDLLGQHLQYGWVYCDPMVGGAVSRIMARHTLQSWKPWLAYSNGPWPSGRIDWHPDYLVAEARVKDQYRWQQSTGSAEMLMTELCPPGGTVLDPFAGSGSFGVSARHAGCRFIGVEADEDRFNQCVERLTDE